MANYEKMGVLFKLALDLQATSEGLSLKDIQERCGGSRRTAERMRNALLDIFPSIEEVETGERIKRWRLPRQKELYNLTSFSSEELATFKTAIDVLAQNNLQDKADLLKGIETKLRSIIEYLNQKNMNKIEPDAEGLMKAEGLVLPPGPRIELNKEILSTLQEAILACKHIKMVYQSKSTKRVHTYTIIPYGFLYGPRDHYLVAQHSDGYGNGKAHTYSLQNIKSIKILYDTYFDSSKFDLNEYAQESFGAFHEKPFEVEWLFTAEAAAEAKNFIFHPQQEMIENDDGTLTVKFKAGGRLEMDWFLYTWGDGVKVIKPKDWYTKSKIVKTKK